MFERGRRRLLNWFLGISAGALAGSILYPIVRYLSPPEIPEAPTNEVEAGRVSDPEYLEKQFKIIRFGNDPAIVVKVAENDFRAFSAICTHLDCIVDFRVDRQLIWCWCHNGIYNLNGKNIGGPPPRPLAPYRVNLVSTNPSQPARVVVSKL
jgi:Rieske Fe-S protein